MRPPSDHAKPAQPGSRVKTIAEVAKRLGVDQATVKSWFPQGCPKEPGRYDVAAIAAWRAAHKKPRPSPAPRHAPPATLIAEGERAKWERRKVEAEAKLKQLALRAKRGELIEVLRAAQIIQRHVAEVVTHLNTLPDYAVAAAQLPADAKEQIRQRLRKKIREMRSALEKSLREMASRAEETETEANEGNEG